MAKHTGSGYRGKAGRYAKHADTSPWNAHYERPATMSLLPELEGARALDVGCGSGWYAEQLASRGAVVTAFDLDSDFVKMTEVRVRGRAQVLQADLAEPLTFAADGTFDLVVAPLVLHYVKHWLPVLQELRRVMRRGGHFVFSTHHPFNDWKLFEREDYFAVELLEDEWENFGKITFYRRPLTQMSQDLFAAGFLVEQILEPRPTDDFRKVNPAGHARLQTTPWFLAMRAVAA